MAILNLSTRLKVKGRVALHADLLAYCGCISLTCLFWQEPYILVVLYVLLTLLILINRKGTEEAALLLAGFLLGPIAELACALSGAWQYSGAQWPIPV